MCKMSGTRDGLFTYKKKKKTKERKYEELECLRTSAKHSVHQKRRAT